MTSAAGDSGNEKPVLNKYSKTITEPPSQGASQAMLYATGLTTSTIHNPQVMAEISNSLSVHTNIHTYIHRLVFARYGLKVILVICTFWICPPQ